MTTSEMIKKTKEMLKVMQAYEDGKTIECRYYEADLISHEAGWGVDESPKWNWDKYEYRIKPEPKYRPYRHKFELLRDLQARHYNYHNVWLKNKIDGSLYMITGYEVNKIVFGAYHVMLVNAFENYTFEDDTPFGIKEN